METAAATPSVAALAAQVKELVAEGADQYQLTAATADAPRSALARHSFDPVTGRARVFVSRWPQQ